MKSKAEEYIEKKSFIPAGISSIDEPEANQYIESANAKKAISIALEQLHQEAKKKRYTTDPMKRFHVINWHELYKIINSLAAFDR